MNDVWWHGTATNDLRGGDYGLHVGTHRAATEALTARIGHPVHGEWDGTRSYGETLLAGKKTLRERGLTECGHNMGVPEHDHLPDPSGHFPHSSHITTAHKPNVFPLHITGPMGNDPDDPHRDDHANADMQRSRGRGKSGGRGYYYRNVGEDPGSVSAVVPHHSHITPIERGNWSHDYHSAEQYHRSLTGADYGFDDEGSEDDWHHHGVTAAHLDLYHRTTPEAAASIMKSKSMTSKERGDVFFSTSRSGGQADGYGSAVVHVRVPEHLAELDDEFPDGEQHYKVNNRALEPHHFVGVRRARTSRLDVHLGSFHRWLPDGRDALVSAKQRTTERPQNCQYGKHPATKSLLWAEGMGYIPVCDAHEQRAREHLAAQGDDVAGVHKIGFSITAADWHHGTNHEFEDFHFEQPGEARPGVHWNNALGPHFAPTHSIARSFGPKVIGANLNLHNPKHYDSEFDMDREAHEHALSQGVKTGIPRDTHPHNLWARMSSSPHRDSIAHGFRQHLIDSGHDGVIYGNEMEGDGARCAVPFHAHQIESQESSGHVDSYARPSSSWTKHVKAAFRPNKRLFGPTYGLDHRLFSRRRMRPDVIRYVLGTLNGFWQPTYGPEWRSWARVYLAGSEASEWTSPDQEGNNDFDILIGIHYDMARASVPVFAPWSDDEITKHLNDEFREHLVPRTDPVTIEIDGKATGPWSNTWYVNPASWDIRAIKPYAAFDITNNRWAVTPPHLPDWSIDSFPEGHALIDMGDAYDDLIKAIMAMPEPYRTQQGNALWEHLHSDRSRAFSPQGEGWYDPANVIEKWLDQQGTWADLWELHHRAETEPDTLLAPAGWSNDPGTSQA